MFSLFTKKHNYSDKHITETAIDYSTLAVDMHSHVLPGIDDGAQTSDESIVLIRDMMALGIKKIIATPHIMADYYRNTAETINSALNLLKVALKKEKIEITIQAAAEYYFDEAFEESISRRRLITMVDNFVLFELPFIGKPGNLVEIIVEMQDGGFKPILAHPERYLYLKLPDYIILKEHGCRMQVNTISLTGYYGKQIKKKAEELADNHLIDFISSDMHHPRHSEAFRDALKFPYVKNLLLNKSLKNFLLLQ